MIQEFRKRVEASVADAIVERIKRADNEESALEDLGRIGRFANADRTFNVRLATALKFLQTVDYLNVEVAEKLAKELERLSAAYPNLLLEKKSVDTFLETGKNADGVKKKIDKTPVPFSRSLQQELALPLPDGVVELQDPWTLVDFSESEELLKQVSPVDGKYIADPTTTTVAWRPLPFYESVALIRLYDATWPTADLTLYFLTLDSNLYRLNGRSPPLHDVNARAPVQLSADNALDYLKFFTFFVRGDQGSFYVIESLDDPYVAQLKGSKEFEVLQQKFVPPEAHGQNAQGHFLFDASVYYSNAIFAAKFAINPTGMIEMLDDDPIISDLPVSLTFPLA